jgi:hypothetical protein
MTRVPQAEQRKVYHWGTLPGTTPDGSKIRIHTGSDIERTAECPFHAKLSRYFEGVTADGWMFSCHVGDHKHYFIARPPVEDGK